LNFALTSIVAYQQPQGEGGDSEERTSIPGSPITIKGTAFGILLESDDLDALDELEALLAAEAEQEGTDQGLTVFYLKYQKAASIKTEFDNMFGLGGGGGAGGGGDLLSGIVGNAVGEGAGELLGGVLGGGGDTSSAGVVSLEGDVQIGMYAPQNLLYISGATQSDLEIIQDAIDLFDQPSPPQEPELAGQSYAILVQHRDPEEIYQLIREQMADYFQAPQQVQRPQESGGNAPEQVAKAMRNAIGGGRKGGGQKTEQGFPKARLGLDKRTDQILLTGPEFIYNQVKAFVESLDTPNKSDNPKGSRILPSGSASDTILKIIQERFGGKIEMVDEADATETANPGGNQGSGNGGNRAGQDTASRERNQRQETADLIRNIRNRAQAGQRGGGQRGGGQRGGGGGRGQRGGGQ